MALNDRPVRINEDETVESDYTEEDESSTFENLQEPSLSEESASNADPSRNSTENISVDSGDHNERLSPTFPQHTPYLRLVDGCQPPPLSAPVYLPALIHMPRQVTPPSSAPWGGEESEPMTRQRLVEILDEALRIMDDADESDVEDEDMRWLSFPPRGL